MPVRLALNETRPLPVPRARAWAALQDLALVRDALPGCESLVAVGGDRFDATLAFPVGLLVTRAVVHLRRDDGDAPRGFALRFDGDTSAGGGRGEARLHLHPDGAHACTLQAEVTAEIAGPAALLGGLLLGASARAMARRFLDRLAAAMAALPAEAPPRPARAEVKATRKAAAKPPVKPSAKTPGKTPQDSARKAARKTARKATPRAAAPAADR